MPGTSPSAGDAVHPGIRLVRALSALCFGGGALLAVAWWFLTPKGFPVTHVRFWANSVFPPAFAAACLLGVVAALRTRDAALKCILMAFGAMLVVSGVVAKCLFPISLSGEVLRLFAICAMLSIAFLGLALWSLRRTPVAAWLWITCLLAGAVVGAFIPWSQRAMEASTRPYSDAPINPSTDLEQNVVGALSLSAQTQVFPDTGRVSLTLGQTTVDISPMLSFQSRSPDRFWTLFAPPALREEPTPSLVGLSRTASGENLDYDGDSPSHLQVSTVAAGKAVRIEASRYLPDAVYSHLNSFCAMRIVGTGRLALAFPPCPGVVEMKPSDYPFGRPARLAYLDARDMLHVVEASSGEKGPFKTLTQGLLKNDEPLTIVLYVDSQPVCRITLYDWARQASRQLSPTAGWGLPENAIEFSLRNNGGSSEGTIFITLAGTSVGRGWDSVGHAARTYRNAMTIEPVVGRKADASQTNQ